MDQPPEQIQSELESFRQQWRAEVTARSKNPASTRQQQNRSSNQAGPSTPATNKAPRRPDFSQRRSAPRVPTQQEEDDDDVPAQSFDEPDASLARGGQRLDGEDVMTKDKEKEPKSALEFYESAVERENTGQLGESLQLYRKAFRMDSRVDISYRDKHFPGRWKSGQTNPSIAPVTVPSPAHHSLEGPSLSVPDLIASFAGLKVEGVPPEYEGMRAPPCPMSQLPDEILVHILRDVAIADVGDFVRLARVCKRLAYLVATENQIWRRVCVGAEFGFTGMHYHWARGVRWEPLDVFQSVAEEYENDVFSLEELTRRREVASLATTTALLQSYGGVWQTMFRRRPRVRFNGCYISTVNYIRPGAQSGHQITWNSPVHIVTYYRYLRLFRDGTAISLLTTDEPAHVVHHLTRDNVVLHRDGGAAHLPSAMMSQAHKGRWRMSSALDRETIDDNPPPPPSSSDQQANQRPARKEPEGAAASLADAEGDLFVETEGNGAKYTHRMELSLRGAGKNASRNNKLAWKGHWSYNKLTDDWAVFTLKNDKPFFFARVRSYGMGE